MLRFSAKIYVFFCKKAIFGKPNATLFISFMLSSNTRNRFFRDMAKFFRHFSKNRVFFWKYLEKPLTSRQYFSKDSRGWNDAVVWRNQAGAARARRGCGAGFESDSPARDYPSARRRFPVFRMGVGTNGGRHSDLP